MPVLDEIRASASAKADACIPEILALAFKIEGRSRWERLRKRQTYPQTEEEQRYMVNLSNYVHFKVALQRAEKGGYGWGSRDNLRNKMIEHREEMHRIEHNLPACTPVFLTCHDAYEVMIGSPGQARSVLAEMMSRGPYYRPDLENATLHPVYGTALWPTEEEKCTDAVFAALPRSQESEVLMSSLKRGIVFTPSERVPIPLSKTASGSSATILAVEVPRSSGKFLHTQPVPLKLDIDAVLGGHFRGTDTDDDVAG